MNPFIFQVTSMAVALEIIRKGCKHYFIGEDIARLAKSAERAKQTRRKVPIGQHAVSAPPPPLPSFFNMAAVSTLSSNAQIGD